MVYIKRLILSLLVAFCFDNGAFAVQEHQSYEEFSKELLRRHNELRKIHNGPGHDLELSKELSDEANDFAKEAARDSSVLEDPEPGQNVFMACSTYNRALTGKEITDSWYDEVCHPTYKFTSPDNKQARSFTQVVWKKSKKIGVGHAVTRKAHTMCTYVVAVYKPNGNVLGSFEENVFKGSFEKEKYCQKPKMSDLRAKRTKSKHNKKPISKGTSKGDKAQFVLNKKPEKTSLHRRTLYYKIPVNFVTAADTGKTFVLPLRQPTREESAFRRSHPSFPENQVFDSDSLKYSEYGNERSNVKVTQDNIDNNEENPDIQADYIKDQLDHTAEQVSPERLSMFAKPNDFQQDSDYPSFENLKMIKPAKKSIEDEYAVNKIALNVHNALRKIHNAAPLKLSPKMSIAAENYARFLAETDRFEHAADIAENLAFSCNTEGRIPSVAEAIKDWYQEACMKDFDFDRDPSLPGTAHFTQIVWKKTKLLGIGRAIIRRRGMTCTYFVSRYDPAGNWVGQFKDNVKKGDFNKDVCKNLTAIIKDAIGDLGESSNAFENQDDKAKAVKDDDDENAKKPTMKPTKKPSESKESKKPTTSATATPTSSDCRMGSIEDQATFARQALRVHNYFRHIHNSPPLGINEDLVRKALESAKGVCMKEKRSEIDDSSFGENVGIACNFASQTVSAAEAVTNWYRQVCDKGYQFDKEASSKDTAKFTQIVWKSTDEIGIAFATKKTKDNLYCTYVVAKYFPAGNKASSYKDNVLRGSFTPSICDSLNTIAFNAAMDEPTKMVPHVHWSLGPQVANQLLTAVEHVAGTFEPFKMPNYHTKSPLLPLVKHSKYCKGMGTENPICRGEIEDEGLRIHNYLRKVHSAKPLKLSPSLGLDALNYAKKIIAQGKVQNSEVSSGESIAIKCSEELTVASAIKAWYKEVCSSNYDFSSEGLQNAGHFTQIVWRASEILGIGKATGVINNVPCTVVVARYEPAGNVIGNFKQNVGLGAFTRSFCDKVDQVIDTPKVEKVVQQPTAVQENPAASDGKQAPDQPNSNRPTPVSGGNTEATSEPGKEPGASIQTPVPNVQASGINMQTPGANVQAPTGGVQASDAQEAVPGANGDGQSNSDQNPSGNEFDDVMVPKPVKLPEKNKGINPKAAQKHPSKTLKGETKPGAKQDKQQNLKKTGKSFSLGQSEPMLQSTEDEMQFNKDGLYSHNVLRRLHLSGELKPLSSLSKLAKNRCINMIEKGTVSQGKRQNLVQQHGENMVILCDATKTDYTAKDAIMNWYGEACDQKTSFAEGTYNGRPNHFTQMVWKNSQYLGMAKVDFKDKTTGDYCSCVIALYKGPGNYIGRVKENVKQGKFDPTKCADLETIYNDAEIKYKEEKKAENAKPVPPKRPTQKPPVTKAPISPTAPTTVGPPGAAEDSEGMPPPTPAIDIDASPTPLTQFTNPPTSANPATKAPAKVTPTVPARIKPSQSTAPTSPGPPSQPPTQKKPQKQPLKEKPDAAKPTQKPQPQSSLPPVEAKPSTSPVTQVPSKPPIASQPPSLPQAEPSPLPKTTATTMKPSQPTSQPQPPSPAPSSPSPPPILKEAKPSDKPSQAPPKASPQPPSVPPPPPKEPEKKPAETGTNGKPSSGGKPLQPGTKPGEKKPDEKLKTRPVAPKRPTKKPGMNKPTAVTPTTLLTVPVTSGATKKPKVNAATTLKPPVTNDEGKKAASKSDFENEAVKAHNLLRNVHGSDPLTLDAELSKSCADYAKRIAEKGALEHSDTKDGENLAVGCSSRNIEMSALQATKNWYEEVCSPGYVFTAEKPNHGTGHFTQVVWKDSKTLGIGKFMIKDPVKKTFCTYIVARYRPAGT